MALDEQDNHYTNIRNIHNKGAVHVSLSAHMCRCRHTTINATTCRLRWLHDTTGPASYPYSPPSPTPGTGQRLLDSMAQKLQSAQTLHGLFNVKITGTAFNGTVNSEVWNQSPNENRTAILQSTLTQFPTGEFTVSNGKQVWQYEPTKKVVYTGSATTTSTTSTPTTAGTPSTDANGGQSQFILNLVQRVFTHSDATLVSSSTNVNGHDVSVVHVVPQGQTTGINFNYDGDVYIDKATNQPIKVDLTISGFGHVILDLPTLGTQSAYPRQHVHFCRASRSQSFAIAAGECYPRHRHWLHHPGPGTATGWLSPAEHSRHANRLCLGQRERTWRTRKPDFHSQLYQRQHNLYYRRRQIPRELTYLWWTKKSACAALPGRLPSPMAQQPSPGQNTALA